MRILHLSKFYPPFSGGLEHVVEVLARGAVAAGHEVRVVCAVGGQVDAAAVRRGEPEDRHGVAVVRARTHGILWSQPIAPGYLRAARWPADVVYVHRPHPLADAAVSLHRLRGIVVFHHSDVQRQRAARLLYQPLARRVAERAAAVVVASQAGLRNAADLGHAASRATVIPLGVDTHRFRPDLSPTRPTGWPDTTRGPVGLFVGRLVGYKGLDVLLDAVTGRDVRVAIVGTGPLEDEVQTQVRDRQLADHVAFLGAVPEAELPQVVAAADYFVLPSTTSAEMFGVAMVEAMACGKPVISTHIPTGVSEVNVPDVTGLVVPPGDATALGEAMARLTAHGELRRRLGVAARQRVDAEYSTDRMITRHLDLCDRVQSMTRDRRSGHQHPAGPAN